MQKVQFGGHIEVEVIAGSYPLGSVCLTDELPPPEEIPDEEDSRWEGSPPR